MAILKELDKLFRSQVKKHHVPGASLAVLRNGRIVATAAAGVVNLDTQVKTTPDSAFQIGSISKPLTGTLIMQLVDEGALSLDEPVSTYLPEFRVARYDVSQSVTIRQLLSHTSGIDGDFFVDSGRGDDAIARLVDKSTMVPSLFNPGAMMSYCNLGYAVLGRVIEVLRGKSYDQVLLQYLFNPLGMKQAFSRPEDSLRFSCAVGHVQSTRKPDTWYVSRTPYLAFGQKAAGSTPTMSASDLLSFAQMHLNNGKSRSGEQILKNASVKAMLKPQVKLQKHSPNAIGNWGLSWFLMNYNGEKLFGHDGATIGQFAFLRILPEKNMAIAMLTNGGDAKGLYKAMFDELLGSLAKVTEPELPVPADRQPNLDTYAGSYENIQSRIDLSVKHGRLMIDVVHKDSGISTIPADISLTFIDKHTARMNSGNPILDRTTALFSGYDAQNKPEYLQTGLRQHRRVSS